MAHQKTSSFNGAVINAMKQLYPEELADKAWDNTGLLVDVATSGNPSNRSNTVLLTNDLTAPVVEEAIRAKVTIIVCYHPVIFRPLKSLTNADPLQSLLLQLISNQIAVYCPHTALDAAPGGMNDWLCDILMEGQDQEFRTTVQPISRPLDPSTRGLSPGYGRELKLKEPQPLNTFMKKLYTGLNTRHVSLALPHTVNDQNYSESTSNISHIAVCVGSGSSVLRGTSAQLIITGEMSHHDALDYVRRGQIVITVFHSNSERLFLEQRLKPQLEARLRNDGIEGEVLVSTKDRDPFSVVDILDLS